MAIIKREGKEPLIISRIEFIEFHDTYRKGINFEAKKMSIVMAPYKESIENPVRSISYDPRAIGKEQWGKRTGRPYKRASYNHDFAELVDKLAELDENEGVEDQSYGPYRIAFWYGKRCLGCYLCNQENLEIYTKAEMLMLPYIADMEAPKIEEIREEIGLQEIKYTPMHGCYSLPFSLSHYSISLTREGVTLSHIEAAPRMKKPSLTYFYGAEYLKGYEEDYDRLGCLASHLDSSKPGMGTGMADVMPTRLEVKQNGVTAVYEEIHHPNNAELISEIVQIVEKYIPEDYKKKRKDEEEEEEPDLFDLFDD